MFSTEQMAGHQWWNAGLQPLSLAYVAWRNLWVVIALTLAGAATASLAVLLLPRYYKASALVLVEPQKVPDRYVSSAVSTDVQDRLATISQQILSNTRLQKIIDDFHLYRSERERMYPEEVLELMRRCITIKLEKGWSHDRPGAFHVEFEGSDPGIVAEITNRLVNLFLEENLRQRELSAEGTSDFLETQLQDARAKLEEQQKKLAEYKQRFGGTLPGQDAYLTGAVARLQQELQFDEDALARDKVAKTTLEGAMESTRSYDSFVAQELAKSQTASGHEKLSDKLAQELVRAKLRFTPQHPAVSSLELELQNARVMEAKQDAEAAAKPPADAPRLLEWQMQSQQRTEAFKNQLRALDQDLEVRDQHRTSILEKIQHDEEQLAQVPVHELEMGSLMRDYELCLASYKSLLEKRESAHIAAEMEHRQKGESFQILDPARTPQKPLGLAVPAVATIGAALGLLIALALAVGRAAGRNKLLGEWELAEGILVLARIPVIPSLESAARYAVAPPRFSSWRRTAALGLPVAAMLATLLFLVYRWYK